MSQPGEKQIVTQKLLSIFGQPDYAISEEKRNGFILNVARLGAGCGLISVILRKGTTFKEMILSQKHHFVLQIAKGTLLGGVTGGLYVASVGQIAKMRGNKDGPVNHFLSAFVAVTPYTILYKQSYKFLFLSGMLWGLLLMIVKSAGHSEFFDEMFEKRRQRTIVTRYPEFYLFQQTKRDIQDGKFV